MNKCFKTLFAIVILPLLILLTGCNSEDAFSELKKLERIDIIASPVTTRGVSKLTLTQGNKQPFEVIGHYSDGSSHALTDLSVSDWHTSNRDVGRFDEPNVFTAVEVGSTTLTVIKDGITSNAVVVNVSAAVITAIQVTPSPVNIAKGQTQQLVALATYDDGTSSTITSSVTWIPDDTNTATVTSAGLLSGVEVGSTTLTATKDGITSNTVAVDVSAAVITTIQVTPSPVNIAKGQTQQLAALAIYSDGTSSPVTSSVTWTPGDTNTATVTSAGLLSGVEMGSTTLTAKKDGITSNTVAVNVSTAAITAIQVTPSPVNIAKGQTQQLVAQATYSDGTSSPVTSSVTWTSGDTNTATVTSAGLLSGVEMGSTTLTATKDGITSNTVAVDISAAVITAIQVTPSSVNIAKGQTQQLVAQATYSDSTSSTVTSSVTWIPVDTNTATVTSAGLLSGVEMGSTTLTAKKDGITSDVVTVDVSAAVITEIQVTPSPVDVKEGETQQLAALATYSDGASSTVTSSVTWTSGDTNTATITSAGLLSGVKGGSTTLTATKDGITSDVVTVNVNTLANAYLDIFDTGSGKLFTNSPSVAYLSSIGGASYSITESETGASGPAGNFARFIAGDAMSLCNNTYNNKSIGGRTNWRLATSNELKTELFDVYGNMFSARGWPTARDYRSQTPSPSGSGWTYGVSLLDGGIYSYAENPWLYASCVSEP